MHKIHRVVGSASVVCGLLFALGGCGGGGTPAEMNSPFQGHYVGTFADTTAAQNGTLDVTVASNGAITGTSHNSSIAVDSTASGSVDNNGNTGVTLSFPSGQQTANGVLAANAQGHLVGNLVLHTSSGTDNLTVDLTKQ